jgi:predicted RNase H-like HicB family nuclease
MLGIDYTLIIETTDEPDFFSFFSPDLEGFTGVGHSIEDCIYNARHGMQEHVKLLVENKLPVPPQNNDPKIIIQNSEKIAA